jgi:hypothetical protein
MAIGALSGGVLGLVRPAPRCWIQWVATPADANRRSPYARYVFDGNVQLYVPPVQLGYQGQIRNVQQEVCNNY